MSSLKVSVALKVLVLVLIENIGWIYASSLSKIILKDRQLDTIYDRSRLKWTHPEEQNAASPRALIVFDGGTTDSFGAADIFLWFSCIVIFAKSVLAIILLVYLHLDPSSSAMGGSTSSYASNSDWSRNGLIDPISRRTSVKTSQLNSRQRYIEDYQYRD